MTFITRPRKAPKMALAPISAFELPGRPRTMNNAAERNPGASKRQYSEADAKSRTPESLNGYLVRRDAHPDPYTGNPWFLKCPHCGNCYGLDFANVAASFQTHIKTTCDKKPKPAADGKEQPRNLKKVDDY